MIQYHRYGLLCMDRHDVGHALRMAMLVAIADGERTRDIGGKLGTKEFTKVVVERMKGKFS